MRPPALSFLAGLTAFAQPRLLLTSDDFVRIAQLADSQVWAASVRSSLIQAAANWPAAHNERYGLAEWQLPPEGGQWTLWYVCPVHGVSLQYKRCPVDNRNFTGWPYDQVIYARRHSDSANAARDCGLAWQLTHNAEHAKWAARILLAYADVYASYPLKDANNKPNATSGGRVTAQTLDEAIWLIPIAWAYDLISDAGVLSDADRAHIERDLLRAAIAVISRNDAKMSNWQSWHNAAVGAVGFALNDQPLVTKAIDGPSGFRFQMRESVFGDGFWYEGAWGYHFFALDPHTQLAEMAARRGIDLYAEAPLRKMFEAPLRFALPDLTLPPFNDSGATSIVGNDRMYEIAFQRYGDPAFASVLGRRARGREALFWGAAAISDGASLPTASEVFLDSGNAVLRAAGSDHTIAFKFGPHGGWHGHYDKLNFISYARGGVMAVDPGTQSYAAKTHDTWDKVTVAHNTVVVDERTQAESTGRLLAFGALPSVSFARAEAGPAYKQAALERTLLLTPEYALDMCRAQSLDGAGHKFDWVYHNNGKLSTGLPLESYSAFPQSNGYQHLSQAKAAASDTAWQVIFDGSESVLGAYGSTWPSQTGIAATFRYSRDQAANGLFSGRMDYDFRASQGYILYSTPVLAGQPNETPATLSVMIHGDGSGHKLALRFYDASDERFVYTVGPITWTGWRQITAPGPAGWSHYLGNNDGIFDGPVKTVAVELTSAAGGPVQGSLYVDDIRIEYPQAAWVLVADFEQQLRNLRLWMLPAAGTTVATGNGLGPDLLKPVPFAMARRQGQATVFESLLEPFGEAPRVTKFEAAGGGYRIAGDDFDDLVSIDEAGALRLIRRAGGGLLRLALANGTSLDDGGLRLVELGQAGSVQVDYSDGGATIDVSGQAEGELRVWAPDATRVRWQGSSVEFRRDGEWCVVMVSR